MMNSVRFLLPRNITKYENKRKILEQKYQTRKNILEKNFNKKVSKLKNHQKIQEYYEYKRGLCYISQWCKLSTGDINAIPNCMLVLLYKDCKEEISKSCVTVEDMVVQGYASDVLKKIKEKIPNVEDLFHQ